MCEPNKPFYAGEDEDGMYRVFYRDRNGQVRYEREIFDTMKEARQIAHIANKAYAMGQRDKATEIREALGVANCGGRHAGGCGV